MTDFVKGVVGTAGSIVFGTVKQTFKYTILLTVLATLTVVAVISTAAHIVT